MNKTQLRHLLYVALTISSSTFCDQPAQEQKTPSLVLDVADVCKNSFINIGVKKIMHSTDLAQLLTQDTTTELLYLELLEKLSNTSTPVILDFYSPACQPCMRMMPIMDDIARTLYGRVACIKVNISEHPALKEKFNVHRIPTLVYFNQGTEVFRHEGMEPRDSIVQKIDALMPANLVSFEYLLMHQQPYNIHELLVALMPDLNEEMVRTFNHNELTFWYAVATSPRPLMVEFISDECQNCRKLQKEVVSCAKKYAHDILIMKVNLAFVTEGMIKGLHLERVPTVLYFNHGTEVKRHCYLESEEFADQVETFLASCNQESA